MIILIKLFLNSKLDLTWTVKFVKQLFKIQIQKGGKLLVWKQVKSKIHLFINKILDFSRIRIKICSLKYLLLLLAPSDFLSFRCLWYLQITYTYIATYAQPKRLFLEDINFKTLSLKLSDSEVIFKSLGWNLQSSP